MLAFRFRAFALLALGAMVVHQLRYALAGGGATAPAAHAYLHGAIPAVVILVLLAAGHLVARVRAARANGSAEPAPLGLARLWPAATAVLIVAYLAQEWAEGGSLGSWSAVLAPLAHGGWLAPALAVVVGAAVALLLRGAGAAIAWAARVTGLRPRPLRPARALRPPARIAPASPNPLASFLAGRAPPPLAV